MVKHSMAEGRASVVRPSGARGVDIAVSGVCGGAAVGGVGSTQGCPSGGRGRKWK